MSRYDEFREMFANASTDERLMIIRSESKRLLSIVYSYGQLMAQLVEERKPTELPDDFGNWCNTIENNGKEMLDLIDALTDKEHRTVYQEEKARHDREFGEMLWQGAQRDMPELHPYTSYRDAAEQSAHRLGLSLFTSKVTVDDSFWYPGGIIYFHTPERRARFGVQAARNVGHSYPGYIVTLEWLVDKRNMKWEQHEGLAQSLDEVVVVLYRWLVKQEELQTIRHDYKWMSDGIVRRDI